MKRIVGAVLLALLASSANAQQPEMLPDLVGENDDQGEDQEFFPTLTGDQAEEAEEATTDFRGAGFGTGLAIVSDIGGEERISSAEVVNGVVRITKDEELGPRVLLNLHYFFSGACDSGKVGKWCRRAVVNGESALIPMRGWGPFVAVQPGSEETISAVGGGLLWGWRRQPDKPDSFNVGFGFLMDQNVKTLGDGLKENEPLPEGEQEIRFKEGGKWGFVLMASWAF